MDISDAFRSRYRSPHGSVILKALQLGDVNRVVPIDKSSTILTIILCIYLFKEEINVLRLVCVVLIAIGTYMMITKKEISQEEQNKARVPMDGCFMQCCLLFLPASPPILGKVGIEGINSNLGTAIRTIVVLIMAWIVVFATGKQHTIKHIEKKELGFICLSGLATGGSWFCYYKALQGRTCECRSAYR